MLHRTRMSYLVSTTLETLLGRCAMSTCSDLLYGPLPQSATEGVARIDLVFALLSLCADCIGYADMVRTLAHYLSDTQFNICH